MHTPSLPILVNVNLLKCWQKHKLLNYEVSKWFVAHVDICSHVGSRAIVYCDSIYAFCPVLHEDVTQPI